MGTPFREAAVFNRVMLGRDSLSPGLRSLSGRRILWTTPCLEAEPPLVEVQVFPFEAEDLAAAHRGAGGNEGHGANSLVPYPVDNRSHLGQRKDVRLAAPQRTLPYASASRCAADRVAVGQLRPDRVVEQKAQYRPKFGLRGVGALQRLEPFLYLQSLDVIQSNITPFRQDVFDE